QHKIFALLLLAIGFAQIQMVRGRFKKELLAFLFPLAALAGSALLVFHNHYGDMSAANAVETMRQVEKQHARFAATGLAIALTSVLAEWTRRYQELCRRSWPVLLMVLGVLLITYTE